MQPALHAGRNAGLLYLTDLGIATVAVDQQFDPSHLAERGRPCRPNLARWAALRRSLELRQEARRQLVARAWAETNPRAAKRT